MNYRAIGDVSSLVSDHLGKIPHDVDLIVGIPRSGMLVASILSLKLNLPLTDLYSFKRNDPLKRGSTRQYKNDQLEHPWEAKKILLIDDSIASGNSMREAVAMTEDCFEGEVLTMVAFAERANAHKVDVFLETVEQPRVFEWNILHHSIINHACVDLDGVLCAPTKDEVTTRPGRNVHYLKAKPLFIPTAQIAHLVTIRPEKYRAETEAWLAEHGVRYNNLHMAPDDIAESANSATWRQEFKAQVYHRDHHAVLYVERHLAHAKHIVKATGKPVFCLDANEMLTPGTSILALKEQFLRKSLTCQEKVLGRLRAYKHAHWGR